MKTTKKLSELWPRKLSDYLSRGHIEIQPEAFSQLINTLIRDVALSVARDDKSKDLLNCKTDEEVLLSLQNKYAGLFANRGQVQHINSMYSAAYSQQVHLSDLRRQED